MKPTGNPPSLRKFCVLLLMLVSYTDTYIVAAPRGGQVVSGTATIQQNGNLTVITAGNRSVINYGSFNIGAGETVKFVQPGAGSSVLNRVVGSASPTEIFGSLQANGHVFIVNPYGIFFRNGSVINVGGLYAGAGNLSDADFTKGKIHFTDLAGDVRNDGIILADNHIALMGVNVVNTGSLKSTAGLAMMVSGKDVYVGEKNGNIFVQANGAAGTAVPAAMSGSVVNRGTVAAPHVLIGGGDLYSTAISNSGLLQGRAVTVNAGRNGTAAVGGTLDASGASNHALDGKGGSIQVLGGTVALQGATVDASGANGGGSVRIGGDFHGGGTLAHANTTTVDKTTRIDADATGTNGDGGSVVVWSDAATQFEGSIGARGGSAGGNGGSAEVSSGDELSYAGKTDLRAPAGTMGTLLLDPMNITVSNVITTPTVLLPTVGFGDPVPPAGNALSVTINNGDLGTALGTANVSLEANNNIVFANSVTGAAVTAGNGNLTLRAGNSITLNVGVTLSLQGALSATFNDAGADATFRTAGAAVFQMLGTGATASAISAPGGATIVGGTLAQTGDGVNTAASTVAANTGAITLQGISTASATAGAPSGNITVTNNSATGKDITVSGALTTTPTVAATSGGNVTITSSGTATVGAISADGKGIGADGVVSVGGTTATNLSGAVNGASLATTDTGTVTLSGGTVTTSGLAGQSYPQAVLLAAPVAAPAATGVTTLTANGGGTIRFGSTVAHSAVAGAPGQDLSLVTTPVVVATVPGTITLTGAAGTATATPLNSLTTSAGSPVALNGGLVGTTAAQTYNGPVTLGADATLQAGSLTLGSTLNGGNHSLTLTIASNVTVPGGLLNLNNFTSNGAGGTTINGTFTTAGGQTYGNAVTLGADSILGSTGNGGITFNSTVAGSFALTSTTGGTTLFGGFVGSVPLASLSVTSGKTEIDGGGVTTSGAQAYNGTVTLGADATLATGSLTLTGGLNAASHNLTLNVGNAVVVPGNITNVNNFTSEGPGGTSVSGTFQTTGSQTYGDALTLTGDTTLKSVNNGEISFQAVDSSSLLGAVKYALTVNTGGVTMFNGLVGSAVGLSNLTTDYEGVTGEATVFNVAPSGTTPTVTTSNNLLGSSAQTYNDPVVLQQATSLSSTNGLAPAAAAILFKNTVNGPGALTLNTTGGATFTGNVGDTSAPGALTVTGPLALTFAGALPTTTAAASIITTGGQTYNGAITLNGDAALLSTSGDILFNAGATINGAHNLSVSALGNETFGAAVGGGTALTSLTTDALGTKGGSTIFNVAGTPVTTVNNGTATSNVQTYNDAVELGADTTLASTAGSATNGGNIVFNGTVDTLGTTLRTLTVNTSGNETFNGLIGSNDPLLGLATDAAGTVGGQAQFNMTLVGAPVDHAGVLVSAGGVTTHDRAFFGVAGSSSPKVPTSLSGVLGTNNPTVSTSGAQQYLAGVTLGNDTVLQGTTLSVTGGITGAAHDLTLDLSSTATVPGIFGSAGIKNFAVVGDGGTLLGGTFQTTGYQYYGSPVSLTAGTTLTSGTAVNAAGTVGTGNIDFNSTLQGPFALTLNPAGTAVFNGVVGGTTAANNLASLTVNGNASLTGGGLITTSGLQNYTGNLSQGVAATLTSTGNTVTVGTLTGNGNDLQVNATGSKFGTITGGGNLGFALGTGTAVFTGTVGAVSLATTGTGQVDINGGTVTTSGAAGQSYTGPVIINAAASATPGTPAQTVLTATGDGPITFDSTLTGNTTAQALTLSTTAAGTVTFGKSVSSFFGLTTLNGTVDLNGSTVTTAGGGQSYGGPVVLGSTAAGGLTTLTDTAKGTLAFTNTVNGASDGTQALVLNSGGNETFARAVGTVQPLLSLTTDLDAANRGGQVDFNAVGSAATPSVVTTGAQTYNDAVVLGANTVLVGGSLAVNSTFNGGGNDLTLIIGGNVTVPGKFTNLNNFTSNGAGGTTINGVFNTTGSQTYGNAVTLAANSTLNGGNIITFGSTVDGNYTLTLNSTAAPGAQAIFNNLVGNTTPLAGLTSSTSGGTQFNMNAGTSTSGRGGVNVGAGGVTINGPVAFNEGNSTLADGTHPSVVSTGGQTYNGAATLQADTALTGAGDITFGSTVDGAFALAASTTGNEVFKGVIGGGTALTGLTTDAPGVAAPGGQAEFNLTLGTKDQAGVQVNGPVTINDASEFDVVNSSTAQPSVLTLANGAQTYVGAVTLVAQTVFTSTAGVPPSVTPFNGGGQITFQGPVTSTTGTRQNLYVRTGAGPTSLLGTVDAASLDLGGALVTFQNNVGPVGIFSVEPNSGTGGSVALGNSITTTGSQTYNSALILTNGLTLTARNNSPILFNSTVNSDPKAPRALTVNTGGLTEFNGLVGNTAPLLSLTTDNEGQPGEQTQFNMDLTAAGTVAGVQVEGAVTINDPVLFDAPGSTLTVPTILTGVLGGTGSQTYNGAATLGQNTVLTDLAAKNIQFGSTVDGTFNLSVNTGGDEIFGGLIGKTNPLASLETDQVGTPKGTARFRMDLSAAGTLAGVRVNGAVNIQDSVEFAATNNGGTIPTILSGGAQTYTSILTGQTYTLGTTVTQNTLLTSGASGGILFNTNVDGPAELSLIAQGGNIQFNAPVGSSTPLAGLLTDARNGFSTVLNGGQVTTAGLQNYTGPVVLDQPTLLADTSKAGTIDVTSTLDGNDPLTVSAAGQTIFGGVVGGTTPLASLTVAPRGGVTRINGGSITTTGAQTYGDAVQLGTRFSTILQSNNQGNITFNSTLDNGALSVFTGGLTVFNGLVGSITPLGGLFTDYQGAPGEQTQFNMKLTAPGTVAGVRTTGGVAINDPVLFNAPGSTLTVPVVLTGVNGGAGSQTYGQAATLAQTTVLTDANSGAFFFQGTVDGPFALTVNTAGPTNLNGVIGGSVPLASLTTDAAGTTSLNAGQVTTTGTQTYADPTTLAQDTVLTSTSGGNLVFGSTLDNGRALNLITAGGVYFDGAVGGVSPLFSLQTDARSTTFLNGGSVATTAFQFYNGAVVLGANTLLTRVNPNTPVPSGEIRFGKTLDSDARGTPRTLTINSDLAVTFNGVVGGVAPLGSLTSNAAVTNLDGGAITTVRNGVTTGAQTYNGVVNLGSNATLTSLGAGTAAGGNVVFSSTLDGAFTLTLNTTGTTQFNGVVGGATPLTGLATDGGTGVAVGGQTVFNMPVGGAQAGVTVNGAVTINDSAVFDITGSSGAQPGVLTLGNGAQIYGGPVALGTSTFLTSAAGLPAAGAGYTGGGGIRFLSPAGISSVGGNDLSVRSGEGQTSFASTINVGSIDLGGAKATFEGPVNLPGLLSVLPNDGGTGGSIEFSGGGLTTAGVQNYRVGIVLGANTVFTSLNTAGDGGNITFAGTLDSDSATTPRALTINTSGNEIFNGLVGSQAALGSLTTDATGPVGGTARFNMSLVGTPAGTAGVNVMGNVQINDAARFNVAGSSLVDGSHPTILTGGSQTYSEAATLAQATALVSSAGGGLIFNSTVDGASGLAVSSAGNEVFNGLVGGQTALASLATDVTGPVGGQAQFNMDTTGTGAGVNVAGTVTANDGAGFNARNVAPGMAGSATVLTGGSQTYNGAATLGQNTVLTTTAGNLFFASTVDGAFGLTTNSGALHVFDGLVGSVTPLASLTTNGGGTQFNANLVGSTAAAGVRIDGPLAVNGTVQFDVPGSTAAQPSVLTLGTASQTYNGAATVAQATVLGATGGGNLVFNSTVDGSSNVATGGVFTLALDTTGLTTLNAAVGGSVPLTSLTTDAGGTTVLNGRTVVTTGLQSYGDQVLLSQATTLTSTAGGQLAFGTSVNGAFDLTLNTGGNALFDGPVGNTTALSSLTTDADPNDRTGTTTFNVAGGTDATPTVRTTGAQTYYNGITLEQGTVLTSGGPITAASVAGGGSDLTVNSVGSTFGGISAGGNLVFTVSGTSTFNAPVTGTTLQVSGGSLVALNGGSVTTTKGGQNYSEHVLFGGDTTLSAQGLVNVASLDGANHTFTLSAPSATFGAITNGGQLLWTVSGLTTLNDTVTAGTLLLGGKGAVALNGGSVTTQGDQTFTGNVILGGTAQLTSGTTITVRSVTGKNKDLTVEANEAVFGQISKAGALGFTVGDTAVFNGAVTAQSVNVLGKIALNGGSVSTSGNGDSQNYRGDVSLGATTSLTSAAGEINSPRTLTGNGHDLTVHATQATFNQLTGTGATAFQVAGTTTINGTVDAVSLAVRGGQTLALNGGRVTTGAFQDYAEAVTLGGDTRLASGGGGNVTAESTLDGAHNLTVDTTGNAVFGGAVGGKDQLATLTVASGGAVVNGGMVQTSGNQQYNGTVTTNAPTADGTNLTSATANLLFNDNVTGTGGSLSVQGHEVLMHANANVSGGDFKLTALDLSGQTSSSLLQLDGTSYTSTGLVTFNGYTNAKTPDLQRFSTIVLTSKGLVTVQGSGFTMGLEQKLIAAGSLLVDVGRGAATVGDLAARQALRINAANVLLLNRPAFTGSTLGTDSGINFVAKTSINFGNARIEFASPENQTANFVTSNGDVTIIRRTGLSIFRDAQEDAQFGAGFPTTFTPEESEFVQFIPEQPVGGGSQTLDTAAAISGALPDQKPLDIPVDVTITSSQMDELRQLGIHPRKAQDRERGGVTSRQALFAQIVDGEDVDNYGRLQPIKGGVSRLVPSDYVVVVDRMSEREVQAILQAFETLYGKKKENAPVIGAAYQKAFDEYGVAKQTADPAGFSPYLKENQGKYPEVDKAARGFDNLFGYIEHMGLTPVEVTKAESHIVSDLNVSGPTPEDMVKVINDQRKNLPPAQKAPSTKVPPAPPLASPGPAPSPAPAPETKKPENLKTVEKDETTKHRTALRHPSAGGSTGEAALAKL